MSLEDRLVADDALVAVDMLVGVDAPLVSVDDPREAVGALSDVDEMIVAVGAAVVDGIEEVGLIDEELGTVAVDDDVWRIDRLEVCDVKDEEDVWVLRLDEVKVLDRLSVVRLGLLLL